ncbi:hybrid sensor histidine kinase/response regulator [Edaphobacter albus]|uniref:hybrid sensor histidine kinase/response regulator n=1 Tax=Edaphobacter sp. 4G125 TaxID=2763071 RepID=UPI001645048F|nr:hybrid sensor histidine kinase/response regulator [Edaphobacter sp. 4G125]QNI35427.1 response regulator [Edaphobacter sp. 4G125]
MCAANHIASNRLRVLLVEDNPDDAFLLDRHLRRNGYAPEMIRVETEPEMLQQLQQVELPDIVLADYNLPSFSGPAALKLLHSTGFDIPFIMFSGAVSEETAVNSMRSGAHDYVSKQNLARLIPAIERELAEAATRRNSRIAERALKASENRFRSLVEALPLGLLISDASGKIVYANRAIERLLGQINGKPLLHELTLSDISPLLSEHLKSLVFTPVNSEPFEVSFSRADGASVEALIGMSVLDPESTNGDRQIAIFVADLSLQKRSEEIIRQTEKLAVAGRLAASISHEINNPLEAVTNCLYLLAQSDLPGDARHYLDLAQQELNRVSQITVQTLRFYRSSTRPAQVDLHELVDTVLLLLDSRIRQMEIRVVCDLRASSTLMAHDGELRQVIANLISNAMDAISDGGQITIRSRSTRNWYLNREGISLTIADNGIGIGESIRNRIFEPFFSTKGITGTGLGLWISKEIIAKHHGSIQVRSRCMASGRPTGTVFRIFIPIQQDASPDRAVPEENHCKLEGLRSLSG